MGALLYSGNGKESYSMGYISFGQVRMAVAEAFDTTLGRLYKDVILGWHKIFEKDFKKQQKLRCKILEKYVDKRKYLDTHYDFIEFLFMSDCDGKLSYKQCGNIYEVVKGMELDSPVLNDHLSRLKLILKYCYSHRTNLWIG